MLGAIAQEHGWSISGADLYDDWDRRNKASQRDEPEWIPFAEPDVDNGLPELARQNRVGVLSNVDDDIFARSRVAPLVRDADVLTSERLRAYKPHADIYCRARERAGGDLVHVATSARDVRGALEAGIDAIRLRRPGHLVDPEGPVPPHEVTALTELSELLNTSQETS